MQGNYGSEHALSLREQFTLVLITQNRPAFLRRALQYYRDYPCTIMVLDSSAIPAEGIVEQFPRVDYQHLPQFSCLGFQAKLKYGVDQVRTPFMAFATDDDFMLHGALNQSVAFLEANPDYGMCHGYCLMYLTHADHVGYYRRDKKVREDYSDDLAQDRVLSYMGQFIPPFYAVTRTSLLQDWNAVIPTDLSFEWQEIGHVYYLLARAKARMLPVPYVVREVNYGTSDHKTEVIHVLSYTDQKSVAERQKFAGFLATLSTQISGLDQAQVTKLALECFAAMSECLHKRRSLTIEKIFTSRWSDPLAGPTRQFGLQQYVELPFYNQQFFDQLSEIEFLLHAMPAGRLQLEELEAVLLKQEQLLRIHGNDTAQSIKARLWQALESNAFNRRVAQRLEQQLRDDGESTMAEAISVWWQRLNSVSTQDSRELLNTMHTGRLLTWLEARTPSRDEAQAIARHLNARAGGPQFGILLLHLDGNMDKLQSSFDSLLDGDFRAFKVVVFTTTEPPAATTEQNSLHFVKVSNDNYIDKLNQIALQSTCDWLLLAEAGDEFTPSGLLRASLELQDAPACRAVAADEIHRQASGVLIDVFRPGFNLDLLQSLPALMARHWLVRREVLVGVGGYSAQFSQALELDLLLRLIEQGGLAGLAHLAEPLLICQAPALLDNPQERQVLTRHLGNRGYQAQVGSAFPGTYQIDYRHEARPLVSIILNSQDNLPELQRCLASVVQRTRYARYEVLVVDNCSKDPQVSVWLQSQEHAAGRIRVLRSECHLSAGHLHNLAYREAKGEYLLLLAADAEVVNANWIELLLNQAQRPEVGVVGAKLIDREGNVTQAGLILGLNAGLGSPFVGEKKDSRGYMQRLVVEQNVSAVSSACLMIRKQLYDAVGGMDEEHFADSFGDVDLCLKVADAGFLTVWTAQVQILHPGTLPDAPAVLAALCDKWQARFEQDSAYNQNLALTGKGFTLGEPTSVNWAQLLA
ncbi:TIGR00180 family glycosyltransferase [Pseudomonas sp. P9_31]|uniref:TIGR00180 family glycosyltransferase n=1 Tax=Pseudomonas sp. P9_31 TaxID=3043448 RepID=UPI002A35F2E0|nr:TIGR00180 family glycosyltransferase [Pseudomonas sp. P9_31]WPN56510.1 TIGR00180 family glycosyltransferase [Pseudomonas sp. P9_31]